MEHFLRIAKLIIFFNLLINIKVNASNIFELEQNAVHIFQIPRFHKHIPPTYKVCNNKDKIHLLYGIYPNSKFPLLNPEYRTNSKAINIQNVDIEILQNIAYIKLHNVIKALRYIDKKYSILDSKVKDIIAKTFKAPKQESIKNLEYLASNISNIPLFLPLYKPRISSRYGFRKHPVKKKKLWHSGIDLVNHKYPEVYATADGKVIKVQTLKGYGKTILIKHGKQIYTKYAHLKSFNVKQGEKVKMGQKIGIEGKTGTATGVHLHYEILVKSKPINPADFLYVEYRIKNKTKRQ